MLEFQRAQLALNEAAVGLAKAEADHFTARDNYYLDLEDYDKARGAARNTLLGAAHAFAAACDRLTKKRND